MIQLSVFEKVVLLLNTCAFVAWVIWLILCGKGTLFSQDGIIAFFPSVPIFFIYVFLFSRNPPDDSSGKQ
jgi:hypothetical protein